MNNLQSVDYPFKIYLNDKKYDINFLTDKIQGIYLIENITTKKKYIGSSTNIADRIKTHYQTTSSFIGESLQKAPQDFKITVIRECDRESLLYWEQYYITKYDTLFPNGYNKRDNFSSCVVKRIKEEGVEFFLETRKQWQISRNHLFLNNNYYKNSERYIVSHYWRFYKKINLLLQKRKQFVERGTYNTLIDCAYFKNVQITKRGLRFITDCQKVPKDIKKYFSSFLIDFNSFVQNFKIVYFKTNTLDIEEALLSEDEGDYFYIELISLE